MLRKRDDSLRFYERLCQKFGSEEDVKVRRLTSIACDIGNETFNQIRSGSNGEGLNLKGSDVDLMLISPEFSVYEYHSDIPVKSETVPLVMDTDDTQPCFTKLRIVCGRSSLCVPDAVCHSDRNGKVLSSKLIKQTMLGRFSTVFEVYTKIHGPCLTDELEQIDLALCLKCDKWLSHSEQWIKRSRGKWPAPISISKIISCGVLFVPIGKKDSINERMEDVIFYSGKILIFSFSHTQLLCYALLKMFLKEIVDKENCLKGLLCSYFIKTLMFWMLEESDPSIWRPANIIPCFQACLHRLLYCVDYAILLHYFIPETNLFHLRFNAMNRVIMCNLLKMLYQQGIRSLCNINTVADYSKCPYAINLRRNLRLVREVVHTIHCGFYTLEDNVYVLTRTLLNYARSRIFAHVFTFFLSRAHQIAPQFVHIDQGSNKIKYLKLKRIISQLLIGVHTDAVTGWIMLASFFYEQEYYFTSLYIINHALPKCTDQIIPIDKNGLSLAQIFASNVMKYNKFMTSLKTWTMHRLVFVTKSINIPPELQLDVQQDSYIAHPKPFAHFLGFLCCYHLKDSASCNQFLSQLLQLSEDIVNSKEVPVSEAYCHIFISIGIAMQMIGETNRARYWLQAASLNDLHNQTSAKIRLSELDFNI